MREGSALLQGIATCGHCGRGLFTYYRGDKATPGYRCSANDLGDGGGHYCFQVGAVGVDKAVADAFLEAITPAAVEASLLAWEQLEADRDAALRQWRLEVERARYEAAFARFCAVFPDAFVVSERGRNYFDKSKDRGRYLSAGFHNLMGYFRDDQPLYELLLDEKDQKELNEQWRELDFIALGTHRTFLQFYLNEAGEARQAIQKEGSEGAAPEDRAGAGAATCV